MSITFLNRDVALRIIYRLCRKVRALSDALLITGDSVSDIFCVKWNVFDWVVGRNVVQRDLGLCKVIHKMEFKFFTCRRRQIFVVCTIITVCKPIIIVFPLVCSMNCIIRHTSGMFVFSQAFRCYFCIIKISIA